MIDVLQEPWLQGLIIGLVTGVIVATMQLVIVHRYVEPRLKALAEQNQAEVWSAARLEFYARCLLTSWSMTHGLPNYLIVRNGRLHMRQGIGRALDEIIEKSTSFDLAVGLATKGLSDDAISDISVIADAMSAAAADAIVARNLLDKLGDELPHIDTIPQSTLDSYVVRPFGQRDEPRAVFERQRRQAAMGIASAIEHILEAARGFRNFADSNARRDKISLDESRRYKRLSDRFGKALTADNDISSIDRGLGLLQKDLDSITSDGLCFVMVDEADDDSDRFGSVA
jgi:hypothetical protein